MENLTLSAENVAVGAPVAMGVVDDVVEEELLIEEISIDGMCGVY